MSRFDITQAFQQAVRPQGERTIEAITGDILEAKRRGGEAILTIGRCLIEAKELLPHGEWLPWLNEQAELPERTAQKFMRLAREWSNPNTLADLGASKALMLLALPPEEREQFETEHNVIDMSARQLRQALKGRDEAQKVAEQAKADAAVAEQARAKMEQDMVAAKGCLEAARAEADLADSRARALEEKLRMLQEKPVDVAVETVVDQDAIDKAREEARAQTVAEMQAKLDRAREAKARAEEKQKIAEAALKDARCRLEEQARKTALGSGGDEGPWHWWPEQPQESGLYWCITGPMSHGGSLYWWDAEKEQWEHAAMAFPLSPAVTIWMRCPQLPASMDWQRQEDPDGKE